MHTDERGFRTILFVELLGGIGDLLMALPAIHALHRSHSGSRVSVFTFAPGGELLEMDPEVAEVIYARRGPRVGDSGPPAKRDLAELLATRSFDLVVSDTRYARMHEVVEANAAGCAVTHLWLGAGRDEPVERLFLRRLVEEGVVEERFATAPLRLPVGSEEETWAADWWTANGLPEGVCDEPAAPPLADAASETGTAPAPTQGKEARALRSQAKSRSWSRRDVVALNPHSGMPIKRWPTEHFVELGRLLRQAGRPVAVLAGEQPALAEEVAKKVPGIVVVPPVPLRRLAGLLAGLGAFVSTDTGPAKLAAAVGTPVIGIFGPTWAGRYGQPPPSVNLQSPLDCPELDPLNFTLQRCWYSGQCIFAGKRNCCEDVRPEAVLAAVEGALARWTATPS